MCVGLFLVLSAIILGSSLDTNQTLIGLAGVAASLAVFVRFHEAVLRHKHKVIMTFFVAMFAAVAFGIVANLGGLFKEHGIMAIAPIIALFAFIGVVLFSFKLSIDFICWLFKKRTPKALLVKLEPTANLVGKGIFWTCIASFAAAIGSASLVCTGIAVTALLGADYPSMAISLLPSSAIASLLAGAVFITACLWKHLPKDFYTLEGAMKTTVPLKLAVYGMVSSTVFLPLISKI